MENKTCKNCGIEFIITNEDKDFYNKIQVPEPKSCPKCRLMRRLLERNTRNLYYRKCDYSGEKIISQYHEKQPFPVYRSDIWWSDKWDPMDYAMEFDFSKSFFEQFKELKNKVPHFSVFVIDGTLQNSDFTNCTGYLKNCYLISESDYDEDCYYSNLQKHSKNMVDCSVCYDSELCYECIDCINCYNLKYSSNCDGCKNGYFLRDCQGCMDCIGCTNQIHKQYMIFNKEYSERKYKEKVSQFKLNTFSGVESLKKEATKFSDTQFHRNLHEDHNENSLGDSLYESKNAQYCFDSKDLEDCKYCARLSLGVKDSMDHTGWGMKCERTYECAACGDQIYNMKFCSTCTTTLHDCEYAEQCSASSYLFGCFGLRHKQYCILNKQYSKEEYEKLVSKIIEHMGGRASARRERETEERTGLVGSRPNEVEPKNREYGEFPSVDLCPFAYNESIAMDYYPLTKEEAISKGYKWRDPDKKEFRPQKYSIPDDINETSGEIIDEILACEKCKRNFKIIEPEYKFYKSNDIPIPRNCSDCRHLQRMKKRPAPELYDRECSKCGEKISTTSPDKSKIIYCKKCYLEAVY